MARYTNSKEPLGWFIKTYWCNPTIIWFSWLLAKLNNLKLFSFFNYNLKSKKIFTYNLEHFVAQPVSWWCSVQGCPGHALCREPGFQLRDRIPSQHRARWSGLLRASRWGRNEWCKVDLAAGSTWNKKCIWPLIKGSFRLRQQGRLGFKSWTQFAV